MKNYLTFIKEVPFVSSRWKKVKKALYKCKCWTIKVIRTWCVSSWHSKSCWCYQKKRVKELNTTHWETKTLLYKKYVWIKKRCTNTNYDHFKHYWWRWIKCEWSSYEEFKNDMWSTFKKWLSIERINNDWNYSKENCTWIPIKDQIDNTSRTIKLDYKGKTDTLKNWCKILWIKYRNTYMRLRRWWTIQKAFETPKLRQI